MVVRGRARAVVRGVTLGTLTLAACSELYGPSETSVVGTVVDGSLQPAPGIAVLLAGRPATTTDQAGRFAATSVPQPYDAVVTLPAREVAVVYTGLTRRDPTLYLPVFSLLNVLVDHHTDMRGVVTGGAGYPEPVNHRSSVLFLSPAALGSAAVSHVTGGYHLVPHWLGARGTTGTVHVLQWQYSRATGLPLSYTGYGSRAAVTLADRDTVSGLDVQLAPVVTGLLSGTVTLPPGYALSAKSVSLVLGTVGGTPAEWSLGNDATPLPEFAYATPVLEGATFDVAASATAVGGASTAAARAGLSANAGKVVLALPPSVELGAPAEGEAGVRAGTRLSWSRASGGVYLVEVGPNDQGPTYWILTADTAATIPDLGPLGFGLPAGASYLWAVAAVTPFASVDATAGPTALRPSGDWTTSVSATRHFTTAP
jgi:hypothetical protein